jgi:hypothetical protein
VSLEGVATNPEKPDAVQQWPPLRDEHKLRSFPVLRAYYRRYIAGLADTISKYSSQVYSDKNVQDTGKTCCLLVRESYRRGFEDTERSFMRSVA